MSLQWALVAVLLSQSVISSFSFAPQTPSYRRITATQRAASSSTPSAGQGGGIFYDGPQGRGEGESKSPVPSSTFSLSTSSKKTQNKDVVVIGGGLAGLSAALYLSQLDPNRHVTIFEREEEQTATTVASFAAAGMLAPQSERLPQGPLLDLCVASRQCYRDFVDLVEGLAEEAGEDGQKYLTHGDGKVGYVASGGFLAPAFAGDSVATWSPPDSTAKWLDATQVRELEPNLNPQVVGGWWFPEDASVDARRLTCALRAACVASGVDLKIGKEFEVSSLDLLDGQCRGLYLESGRYVKTKSVLVANGAWMRQLLPVPVEPHKGQSLSLRMPADRPPLLKRVLFAQDSYIVPKSDGRIVVGATVEAGSYDPNVTPAGLMHILHHAMQLVPGLSDLPIEETWVGLRPTTPDKGPIIGKTSWNNLFLAGGYWRNGVLLAPKTGQMLAQLIAGQEMSDSDQDLLDAFSWDRFTTPEGSKKMEMDARFAASFYPVHRRTEGSGISAAVGTELGSYSTARSASSERAKDRASLFGDNTDDLLEKAAQMGIDDASAFSGYEPTTSEKQDPAMLPKLAESDAQAVPENTYMASLNPASITTTPFEGSADAFTVQGEQLDDGDNLPSIYESIQANQATRGDIEMGTSSGGDNAKPDPGFRIYHIDPDTDEQREVPPFTTLGEVEEMLAAEKTGATTDSSNSKDQGDSILDGYQAIEDAAAETDDSAAAMMRAARTKNRSESSTSASSLDLDPDSFPSFQEQNPAAAPRNGQTPSPSPAITYPKALETSPDSSNDSNLSDIYKKILSNKAASVEMMEDAGGKDLPDPGFRIYYVDPETGEHHEVPPYSSSPDGMQQMVAKQKRDAATSNSSTSTAAGHLRQSVQETEEEGYSEKTYDGYTAIEDANSRNSREEELEAMRAARRKNRLNSSVDSSKIGVVFPDNDKA